MTSMMSDPRNAETGDGPKIADKIADKLAEGLPSETADAAGSARPRRGGKGQQFKREKFDVHGWVVLDKPIGMTSTYAVAVIKRLFAARRAGHAGTLDPLASGCLPIALGDAT